MGIRSPFARLAALFCLCLSSVQANAQVERIPVRPWKAEVVRTLPKSVDNSTRKYFPPIIYQIGGSCAQASNIGYLFTYEMNRLLDRDASLAANRFSYLFAWNFLNEGKDTGSFGHDGLDIALSNGILCEEDFPRQTHAYQFFWASGFEKYLRGMHYRIRSFLSIRLTDREGIDQLRQYLYDKNRNGEPGGIVTFSARAGNWTFDTDYKGPSETGYRYLLTELATKGAHAMTIVGYDDLVEFQAPDGQLHHGAFIVANTHGSNSQDRGRFYLPYWFFLNNTDYAELSDEVIGAEVEYRDPKIVFRVALRYTSRDDLSFEFGVSSKPSDPQPFHNYTVPIALHQGGDYCMQGNGQSAEIEFAFDFTPHLNMFEEFETPKYFLTVNRNDLGSKTGEGEIHSFSVYDYREDPLHPKIHTCPDIAGKKLTRGRNLFGLPTSEVPKTSRSSVKWLNREKNPSPVPLVLKTAEGKYAKMKIVEYDRKKGTLKIKYVYAPSGSRNLKAQP